MTPAPYQTTLCTAKHRLIWLGLLLLWLTPQAYAANERIALVIGNGAYQSAPLSNPVNDAQDMAAKLADLGFAVSVFTDLDRKGMREAIRDFGEKLKTAQVGLFYFAGHGIQLKGRNYLIPLQTDVSAADEVEDESIDAGLVLRKMESAGNQVNIVILDACRNNPFARSFRSLEQGLAKMDGPIGSFIAYATAPGSVAADGSGRNGLYTQYLLQALNQPGLSIEQTFKAVRKNVSAETDGKQIPWESSSLTGEFYFDHTGRHQSPQASVSPPPATLGYLQIIANVPKAEVSVNQVPRGQLDEAGIINVSPLSGEQAEIVISAPGYRSVKQSVKLTPGQWLQHQVTLQAEATAEQQSNRASSADNIDLDKNHCLLTPAKLIMGVRSEMRPSGQAAQIKLNDPALHATIFTKLKNQGLAIIDQPAEAFANDPAQLALKLPAITGKTYWLKVYVSAGETPITTIETQMKTVQGDISLQLVDLENNRLLAETAGKFRKAGLDMGLVVNQALDGQLPKLMQTLLLQTCH